MIRTLAAATPDSILRADMPAAFPPAAFTTDPRAHLAFVEVMASVDESEPPWRPTVAGFLALRLVDRWADSCNDRTVLSPRELSAVRNAVSEAPAGPIREALSRLVAAIADSWGSRTASVTIALLAYAHLLQHDEEYGIAADAYQTFLSHADAASDDVELLPDAYQRLGFCLRMIGRLDAAETAYETAIMVAEITGDLRAKYVSRLGAATIAKHRGNLPAAEGIVEQVVAEVTALRITNASMGLADVSARAKHDLGTIACHRGDSERALVLLYDALQSYEDEGQKEAALHDIATNLAAMGLYDAARDAHLVNYMTARRPYTRLAAAINLMELAAIEGRETNFEQYRRELAGVDMPPAALAHYQLYAGEGCERFGRDDSARSALKRALAAAAEYQVNEVTVRAEAGLDRLARRVPIDRAVPLTEAPLAVAHVVRGVRQLRESAASV